MSIFFRLVGLRPREAKSTWYACMLVSSNPNGDTAPFGSRGRASGPVDVLAEEGRVDACAVGNKPMQVENPQLNVPAAQRSRGI